MSVEKVHEVIESLHEFNPMMGHRGCRLTVTYPEIAEMQTTAVINAAINVQKKGVKVIPQIMIPLVGEVKEFDFVKKIVVATADKIIADSGVELKYEVGTMIAVSYTHLDVYKRQAPHRELSRCHTDECADRGIVTATGKGIQIDGIM